MNMWQKVKNIRIPGSIVAASLTGAILGTTMALFTVLPVAPPTVRTSEESISGKNESLDLTIRVEKEGELHLKATGATTMAVVLSLQRMLRSMEGTLLLERSSPSTSLQEE